MSKHLEAVVPRATIAFYRPGVTCETTKPGDLLLVHDYNSIPADFIRFGARIRKLNRPYSWANHAAGIVQGGQSALVCQETGKGSILSGLSAFHTALYCVISPLDATDEQRSACVDFWKWTLDSGYDWLAIVGDAVDDITGVPLVVGSFGRMVCSANASRGAERWGLIPDKTPSAVQPPDIARYFNIRNEVPTSILQRRHR